MDWINSAVLQSDGKLVVGGFSANKMALARYLTTGSLDPTFGVNGLVTTTITTASQAIINGLALTPDAIYACGFSIDAYGNSTLVKYDYAGNVALDFGANGILINNLGGIDLYKDIKVKNNKLVVGGTINTDGIFNFSLSQFELNGDPVLSFGTNGVFTVAPTNFINGLESIAIQSDGKILAAGVCQDFPRDIAIVRVVSNTLVSVKEDQPESDLVIYPNPTSDFIKINGSIAKEITQITLTDALGKVLYQVPNILSTSEKEWIIDLSNHASGSYFLTLLSKAGSTMHKVVKK